MFFLKIKATRSILEEIFAILNSLQNQQFYFKLISILTEVLSAIYNLGAM